jgi:parallel beta-helix repeat protein
MRVLSAAMPATDTISPEHRLALPVGYQLEGYRILKVLGQGGFGITYLAEDIRMNHEVAIKELCPTDFATRGEGYTIVPLTQSDEPDLAWAKQRFIEEARILVRLNHPNIVRFFRYFELNSTAYLVMEFVRGENFKAWMRGHPQPSEKELKALLLPLLDGLEYVHRQPLLHRDISPENVMITEEGRPILLDFGSARAALGNNPKTEVVRRGFSPIEQYQRNSPQGPYTDLYALSGIVIQAISGEPPPDSIDRFGSRDPYQPVTRRLRGRYSGSFLQALDTAFAALPADRPQNVAHWRQLLEISSSTSRPPKRVRRALIVAVGALGLLICGTLYYLATTPKTLAVPDQYPKIQLAIDAARVGDTVLVKAGFYDEALHFKNGIKLRGVDRDTTIVNYHALPKAASRFDSTPPLSIYHCQAGEVANLTFQETEPDPRASGAGWRADAIIIVDSTVTVINCSASSAAGDGIAIYGASSAPKLTGNRCDSNNLNGILFSEGAQGEAAQNICEKNKGNGIALLGSGTNPVLSGNQCRTNLYSGILIDEGAQGKVDLNICEQNGSNGIIATGAGTNPVLTGNQCRGHTSYFGIVFSSGSKGTAEQNICEKNGSGIAVMSAGTSPVFTGNQCRSNIHDGIAFSNGGQGKAIDNLCEKNGGNGISLQNASPFFSGNQLFQNGMYGLLYDSLSKYTIGKLNIIFGNRLGDSSLSTPAPTPGTLKPLPTPTRVPPRFGVESPPPRFGVESPTPSPTPTPSPFDLSQWNLHPILTPTPAPAPKSTPYDFSKLKLLPTATPTPTPTPSPFDFSQFAFPSPTPTRIGTPLFTQDYYNRAELEIGKKEYQAAIEDLTNALQIDPNDAAAYSERGRAYLSTNKYHEAFADFDKAVNLEPKEEVYYYNRGLACESLEEYTQATSDFTKAITLKPDYAHPYLGRGDVYYKMKRYNDAVKEYTEAIRLDPKSSEAYRSRGDAYSRLGLEEQAKMDYAKAKELLR